MSKKTTLALVVLLLGLFVFTPIVHAAELTNRRVIVASPLPSATTQHLFVFTVPSSGVIGSIRFQYCTDSPVAQPACAAPTGLDLTGASLSAESGITGFSVDAGNTTQNSLLLTRPPLFSGGGTATYTISGVVNPSTPSTSVFVRMFTYITADGSGTPTDNGSVVFTTEGSLATTGYVPPYLTVCVGLSVAADCTSTSGSQNSFGEFTSSFAAAATSQFAASTNDPGGYSCFVQGSTMTAGNNTIPALATPAASNPGTSQFGINLRSNAAPTVGVEPTGVGTATPSAGYATPNQYQFIDGSLLVSSSLPTEFNVFTVSYIVNVAPNQPAGVYATTMTFIFTAAF